MSLWLGRWKATNGTSWSAADASKALPWVSQVVNIVAHTRSGCGVTPSWWAPRALLQKVQASRDMPAQWASSRVWGDGLRDATKPP